MCHTYHKYQCHVSLVNKCFIGDLLVTDFNKVWRGGWIGVGCQKVIPRLVGCSRPKAKIGRERETQILNVAPLRYCFPFLRDFRSKTFLLYYTALLRQRPTITILFCWAHKIFAFIKSSNELRRNYSCNVNIAREREGLLCTRNKYL
jgi:hypothetical protein